MPPTRYLIVLLSTYLLSKFTIKVIIISGIKIETRFAAMHVQLKRRLSPVDDPQRSLKLNFNLIREEAVNFFKLLKQIFQAEEPNN